MITSGDDESVECPVCGAEIKDLWNYGGLCEGSVISCPHCGRKVRVVGMETVTEICLVEDEADQESK